MDSGKRILFATGGTGGHINPALAVAGYIRKQAPDTQILFVGTAEKMEAKLVPAAGFDFRTIDISGFQRSLTLNNIKRNLGTLSKLLRASSQAKKILLDFKPDVVVGFGGYVSGPVLRMAAKLGIPTAIHEQNAYPGVTNKALAKKADAVMLTVQAAEQYLKPKNPCILTGLPVRGEIVEADRDFARAELRLDERPMILSMGGSLGARAINEAVVELIANKAADGDCYFHHAYGQYGKWVPDKLREKGVDFAHMPNITVREYIDDMDRCLAAADLVICRAGASSLSEFEAVGRASILIPSPNVAENHQYHNAMALVNNNAAVIIEEKDLTGERLTQEVNRLLADRDRLRILGENAKKMAIPDTVERIADILFRLAKA
ncbi:MAG: undecaprenyldiphospho-muramoylpentapeptide beta-N-acetylglucosaminyltransferase [Oscillospiraceae bacterium]|nr:undecaprenyldiphospho-muramoylpentapeptide beta-N-acetylglucosaminyltransferase [Oscillospiraceae bacterium]